MWKSNYKFISEFFCARQFALVSALALLLSTLALGISTSDAALAATDIAPLRAVPPPAADVVTNVSGVEGNASVTLSWTAPNSNLPLTFDATVQATVFHGGGGGDV